MGRERMRDCPEWAAWLCVPSVLLCVNTSVLCEGRLSGVCAGCSMNLEIGLMCMGGGRRACPGKNLAYATMNIAIASIIQCIDLKVIASRHLLTETSLRIHRVIGRKNQSVEKRGHETLL
ncbi:Cytochrome P450 [Corchorus olitorius]|uniref:Cytochrome P450 n=1 Tax=Corchorus olitorius TaxID=93759 RepID=A0A1R3G183_9ROSI|nr:Cytochrome P450 [Corchorus olitorius]